MRTSLSSSATAWPARWTVRGQPVITGYQPDELPPGRCRAIPIPWPNRIDHGRYDFGGHTHQLDLSEPAHDNAIHGLTRWLTWQLAAHSADSAELTVQLLGRPGYPFRLDLTARYQLTQAAGPRGHHHGPEHRQLARSVRHRVASLPAGWHWAGR